MCLASGYNEVSAWLRELGAHVADPGLRCSGGQEAVWLHGTWHEECYDT